MDGGIVGQLAVWASCMGAVMDFLLRGPDCLLYRGFTRVWGEGAKPC